ncbi:protein FAM98B [Spodoptera frugiperda]|uniref:Protein FAM98B n=1 Tax=Spodoptera frugiperda TaxID=7108 RepID=A0A9R0DZ46_SPOFR|nr:protein FAM98B [Spodoptera frugiperda]
MENDILDSLNDLGYEGPLTDEASFAKALDGGPKSLDFTKLVHILAEEIKNLCNLEETVNMMNDPDESSSFLLELSSFLKELKCPYKKLVTGHMSSRLQTKEDRLLLLDYLISELMAARMVNVDGPKDKQAAGMEIVVQESPTARDLKNILIALKFNKPPPNITAEMLFAKLEAKLKDTIQKEGDQLVGKPLYNKALSEKEWKQLETAFNEMFEEYRLRRETLITRLECTIQSFEWSDRLKTKRDVIQSTYRPKRESLKVKPDVKLADFLAARTSLLQVEKTSNASVRKNTQTDVNKVIIGQVPDRGGRPNEQQPPPPEMPSWTQRNAGGGGGGGGRGGRGGGNFNNSNPSFNNSNSNFNNSGPSGGGGGQAGRGGRGGRGGRVQGGYSQGGGDHGRPQQNRNYQTYEVPPGGYNQNQYSQAHTYEPDQNYNQHNQGYSGYNQAGYDSMGSYNQGYQGGGGGGGYKKPYQNNQQGYQHNQGYQGNQGFQGNQGYHQGRGGYQNEHDDRDRRGRGGYRGGRR